MIEAYLQRIRRAVVRIAGARVESYAEQILSPGRANLRLRLSWPSGAFLEVSEAIEERAGALCWLSYRYHFQDAAVLLRYDNAPHYRHLTSFPDHRHEGTEVAASAHPDLEAFFGEVRILTGLW